MLNPSGDMLNPSGYQNISEILTLVGERASIDRYCKEEKKRQRKWIFLENDGGHETIMKRS